jgi:hypothetical protein
MLRTLAILLGLALLCLAGVLACHAHTPLAALGPGVMGALIVLGTLIERFRYRRLGDVAPGPDWTDTGERFRDPATNAPVAVYFHTGSGERRYIRLGSSPTVDTGRREL